MASNTQTAWPAKVMADVLVPERRAKVLLTYGAHYYAGKAAAVTLLGHPGALEFTQDERGLRIKLPAQPSGGPAWVFKIEGLTLP